MSEQGHMVEKFNEIHQEAMRLFIAKNNDYGGSWLDLGARGVFVRWHDKYKRLRTLLWEGRQAQVGGEATRDTLIDALNYNLMMLYLHDQAHPAEGSR